VDDELRIDFHEQVNMVGHHLDTEQRGLRLRRHVANDLLQPFVYLIDQDGAAEFRAPHDVVLAEIDDVSIALVLHILIIYYVGIESRYGDDSLEANVSVAFYPHG
jgi:hypothetical protein